MAARFLIAKALPYQIAIRKIKTGKQ